MTIQRLLISLTLAFVASCGSTETTPPSGPLGPIGKGDSPFDSSVVVCNDGDMVISADPERDGYVLVTVTNQGVIDYFEAQSEALACGPSYYGGEACVEKQLPWQVSIESDPDDAQLRRMVIEELRDYGTGRYLTSEPGTELRARDGGYDVTIKGMRMPNSHTLIRYEVAHWFFERCELAPLPVEPLVTCNEGAMVIDADVEVEGQVVLTISDEGVIDFFEAQSHELACGWSYYGGEACVDKELPWYVSIVPDADDPQRRLLVIEDLRDYGNGRYLTSEPGTEARARDGGYDVTINGMKMPNSHTVIRYEVGRWFFERCE